MSCTNQTLNNLKELSEDRGILNRDVEINRIHYVAYFVFR